TMQCREDVYENLSYVGGRLGLSGVAHQNGTIRFGTDPATSALDLDCKLHEVDNVYVADSSFFVSSSAVNPTLTIIANALRVAEAIATTLGTSTLGEPSVRPHVPAQLQESRSRDGAHGYGVRL
ncbi:MAG: GMC oxidoreductase, partial [Rhodoglobus sp.]